MCSGIIVWLMSYFHPALINTVNGLHQPKCMNLLKYIIAIDDGRVLDVF